MATITSYNYTLDEDFAGIQPDFAALAESITDQIATQTVALGTVTQFGASYVEISFADVLSPADKTTLDKIVALHPLTKVKAARYEEVDVQTVALIDGGFPYNSQIFSLSIPSQITMLGLDAVRNDPAFVFPVNLNVKDDTTDPFVVPDAPTAHDMFMTAVATYRGYKDAGTALKNQIRAAQTVADVNAVVDNRKSVVG